MREVVFIFIETHREKSIFPKKKRKMLRAKTPRKKAKKKTSNAPYFFPQPYASNESFESQNRYGHPHSIISNIP